MISQYKANCPNVWNVKIGILWSYPVKMPERELKENIEKTDWNLFSAVVKLPHTTMSSVWFQSEIILFCTLQNHHVLRSINQSQSEYVLQNKVYGKWFMSECT